MCIERCAFAFEYLLAIALGFGLWIDPADAQVIQCAIERIRQMGGRIGGGQMHRIATARQFNRQRRGQGRFADPALAHQHDQTVTVSGNFIDQC